MLCLRGQARDYNEWAALCGDPGWSWESVLPLFKSLENHWGGASEHHGGSGEWRVEKQRLSWELLDAFSAAAVECGIPRTPDFNCGDNEGVSRFEVNQRRGVRWNASKAFLRPAQHRPNLTVMTGCMVRRLTLRERVCEGVEFIHEGTLCSVRARRRTILAAGAIGSPQILQLSGIGPGPLLQELGIPVVHALPGVGANLQDHLQLRMAFRVSNTRTLNTMVHSLWGKTKLGLEYALRRSGPLSMAPSQLGAFARSDAGQASANIEYHVQPLSLDRFGEPLHRFDAFTASVCNLRPTSRGQVRIDSPDPANHPRIAPNYLASEADRQVAIDSLRLTRRIILKTAALRPYSPREFLPGPQLASDEALLRAAGDIGTTIFHPVGTCRMGRAEDASAVVGPDLSVHGMGQLSVIDASVMPSITSGNTNTPTLMIAERGARILTGRR
jgi:choline dehydrogenase